MKLTSPVNTIPKIGPKYEKLLHRLEIETVEDLLYHFPFRYDDFSKVVNISKLVVGEEITIKGQLLFVENIYTKNRKRLTKGKLKDSTGEIDLVWFNQHYLKRSLKPSETYFVSGKVTAFSKKLSISSPAMELAGENLGLNTGRLVPVYPETRGLTSKWLRAKINSVLNSNIEILEFLPEKLLNDNKLTNIVDALEQFHFPESLAKAEVAKKRFAFEEFLLELLRVEHRKEIWKQKMEGVPLKTKGHETKLEKFETNLPFTLTKSQKRSIEEIFKDVSGKHPMNRLLEGDVGTGKTIVAIAAAYLTYLNGYKTLYMAPTGILAEQHYSSFTNHLSALGAKIELKTGGKRIDLSKSDFDIAIGTHALLFNKKNLEKVGLVVIDEQHRFGVKQRAKLASMSNETMAPNLLTMTATPIPRTLALTLYGDLSISTLDVPPNKDKKITTKVVPESKRLAAYKWIRNKAEPTFIVCPLIEESDSEALENVKAAEVEFDNLRKGVFKGLSIGLLHGRMKPKEKQEIVEQFKKGELQILVSTPVIEVGIDIPEATVIVIESAERYGLASLHQLRGRVGRGQKEAFCLLFQSSYSKPAYARLKNLEKIDSGLELAEIDMKYRGQGDVYGTMQHGFKRFKVASMSNLALLEQAKKEAKDYYNRLNDFPLLKEKLDSINRDLVGNN